MDKENKTVESQETSFISALPFTTGEALLGGDTGGSEPIKDKPEAKSEEDAKPSGNSDTGFNEVEYLNELTGGAYKTKEEVAQAIQDLEKLRSESEALRGQLDSAYVNDFTRQVNEMVKSGADISDIELFFQLSKTEDISKMDSRDAIIQKMLLEDGDLTKSDAELLYSRRYFESAEDLADYKGISDEDAEAEFRIQQIELNREAKAAREFLSKTKANIFDNTTSVKDKMESQVLVKSWENITPILTKGLSQESQTVSVKDENAGIDTTFEIKLPEEFIGELSKTIPQWAAGAGLNVDDESIEAVKQEAIKAYIANNFSVVIESAIRDTWSKAEKAFVEGVSNPNKPSAPNGVRKGSKSGWESAIYG